MINLELVEHVKQAEGIMVRTVVAVSTSHTALREYCKDTYGKEVVKEHPSDGSTYYTVHEAKIKIVQFDYTSKK